MKGSMARRFIVDSMLGKLAKWLRILGFDARCNRIFSNVQIAEWGREGFIVVTRNRRWGSQWPLVQLTPNDPMEQLRELVRFCGIGREEAAPLERCIQCNGELRQIPKEEARGAVPDFIYQTHPLFHQCPGCGKIYWLGSHPGRIKERIRRELGWTF